MRLASLACTLLLVACGSPATTPDTGTPSTDTGVDAGVSIDTGADAPIAYPAPHESPPQVVASGGPVLASPEIQPVFFSNDDPAIVAQLSDFVAHVGASSYFRSVVMEYGVGAATARSPIMLTETATGTIDDVAIQSWLANELATANPAFPVPDANTLFVLFYPISSITLQGSNACQDFASYHSELSFGPSATAVPYVVVPRCADVGGLSGIDALTAWTSHELVEASTDPFPNTSPAYAAVDSDHAAWAIITDGGEIADLCAQSTSSFVHDATLGYEVQRAWSNAAAMAGHDPCVPAPAGDVYFGASVALPDTVTIGGASTHSIHVAAGGATTTLHLFSDARASGPMTITVHDGADLFGHPVQLMFSTDHLIGVNGDALQLTITPTAAFLQPEPFVVTATIGTASSFWVGLASP